MSKKMIHRLILNSIFFIVIMLFTFYIVFQGQSFGEIVNAIKQMPCQYTFTAIFLALLFVSAEGVMIWYLLKGIGEQAALPCCIAYSFIGFFFSGITPSATGGQPVQMYYMKRNGNSLSASSVVLMTIAISYKLVLVLIGIGMWIFWNIPLKRYLRGYYWLYFLGLFLNIVVVIILILVMFSSKLIRGCFCKLENVLVHLRLWKKDNSRIEKIDKFLSNYRNVVYFLKNHKKMIITTIVGTFIQRLSIFVLTYIVYCGLGFRTAGMADVILLQAAIYVAVDMLPIPGAQGVTEAMYKNVFRNIFSGKTLLASMCIIRGIGFYFLLLIGFVVFCIAGRTSIKKCHERNL